MADRSRNLAPLDLGVEVLAFAAPYGLDEVLEMVLVGAEALDLGPLIVVSRGAQRVTPFALHAHADARALEVGLGAPPFPRHALFVLRQVVDLVEDRRLGIVIIDDLRVGHLAGIVEDEPAADAHRPPRKARVAENPSCRVHLVYTLVARLAVAHVPGEAAIVLESVAIDGLFSRGPHQRS